MFTTSFMICVDYPAGAHSLPDFVGHAAAEIRREMWAKIRA
jgi:hypothetical protein